MSESRSEIAELKSRWSRVDLNLLSTIVKEGRSPFGLTDRELVDFRGIELRGAFNKMAVSGFDFAFSSMGTMGQLGGAFNAVGCRFDGCRFESTLDGIFEECTFVGSRLARSTIRKAFRRCDFAAAKMEYVAGDNIVFEACDFSATNLRHAELYRCQFIGCRLVHTKLRGASLAGSKFVDSSFEDVELDEAILANVSGLQA